jgi:hypothetical protein
MKNTILLIAVIAAVNSYALEKKKQKETKEKTKVIKEFTSQK